MKASTLLASVLTLVTAATAAAVSSTTPSASPKPFRLGHGLAQHPRCITQAQAEQYITRYIGVLDKQGSDLGNATQTLRALIADDFELDSNSILSLEGKPLGGAAQPSKAAYVESESHAPPSEGVSSLAIYVANCNRILWHYEIAKIGTAKLPVRGFNLFELTDQLQCSRLSIEFDSVAWGVDIGGRYTYQDGHSIGG